MRSLFKAKIFHKRFLPNENEFSYSGFYIKVSLANLKELNSLLFSVNKFNLFSFYEKDYGYRDGSSPEVWAKDILNKAGLNNFKGRLVLHTVPRVLGYAFNPVCFWYCYDKNKLFAIICEVNNTFGESHNYVIKKMIIGTIVLFQKNFTCHHFTISKVSINSIFQKIITLV